MPECHGTDSVHNKIHTPVVYLIFTLSPASLLVPGTWQHWAAIFGDGLEWNVTPMHDCFHDSIMIPESDVGFTVFHMTSGKQGNIVVTSTRLPSNQGSHFRDCPEFIIHSLTKKVCARPTIGPSILREVFESFSPFRRFSDSLNSRIVVPLLTGNVFGYIATWQCANLRRPRNFGLNPTVIATGDETWGKKHCPVFERSALDQMGQRLKDLLTVAITFAFTYKNWKTNRSG